MQSLVGNSIWVYLGLTVVEMMHAAAALGSTLAHGVSTAEWFADDGGNAPRSDNGYITLPQTGGLGCGPLDRTGFRSIF